MLPHAPYPSRVPVSISHRMLSCARSSYDILHKYVQKKKKRKSEKRDRRLILRLSYKLGTAWFSTSEPRATVRVTSSPDNCEEWCIFPSTKQWSVKYTLWFHKRMSVCWLMWRKYLYIQWNSCRGKTCCCVYCRRSERPCWFNVTCWTCSLF